MKREQNRINSIIEISGMKTSAFCRTYGIPRATLDKWVYGIGRTSDWVLDLLERVVKADAQEEMTKKAVVDFENIASDIQRSKEALNKALDSIEKTVMEISTVQMS